jgi:bifunctional DNA-binding transcriptional regulator/antitoxin component of YhaV-PrlF toxin-antitoxin module
MELARVTTRGQVTLPPSILRTLKVKDGSKIMFFEENGRVIIENAGMIALQEARDAMRGEAERLGLKDEQDVVTMIKDVRRERRQEKLNAD